MENPDQYFSINLPIGRLYVAYNHLGISATAIASDDSSFEDYFLRRFQRSIRPELHACEDIRVKVRKYLDGYRGSLSDFDLRGTTAFQRKVLETTLSIPRGEVRTYTWVANKIGNPKALRAVGTALASNPVPILIPCHRVVRSDGVIGKYLFGTACKQQLLHMEDVKAILESPISM